MRAAQRGRLCLKGQWSRAVTVQLIGTTAGLVLLIIELLALRLTGIGAEQTVHVADWLADAAVWPQAAIIAGVALLDLLLLSPLKLGQAAYYDALAAGQEAPAGETCAFRALPHAVPQEESETLSLTHEFVPPQKEDEPESAVPVQVIWQFYRNGYGRAVAWRAILWGWRTLYGLFCFLPATLLFGYGEMIRMAGDTTPLADITRLFCGAFGLFALLAGWVVQQLLMLRYMPAQYQLARMPSGRGAVRAALRESRRLMKGNVGRTAWLYIGFSGWLLACVLVVPYYYVSPLFLTTRAAYVRRLTRREEAQATPRLRQVHASHG